MGDVSQQKGKVLKKKFEGKGALKKAFFKKGGPIRGGVR